MNDTRDRVKVLHRADTAQAQAQRELQKVHALDVSCCVGTVGQYIGQLTSLLQQQIRQQSQHLDGFDSQEEQWTEKFREATGMQSKFAAEKFRVWGLGERVQGLGRSYPGFFPLVSAFGFWLFPSVPLPFSASVCRSQRPEAGARSNN